MLVADGEDAPRLSAVVERQRRALARVRADREADVVVAMARGVLMERHGWAPAEAARQLVSMAAAAGLPEPEMAAAVLAQEPLETPAASQPDSAHRDQGPGQRGPADQAPSAEAEAEAEGEGAVRPFRPVTERSAGASREWIEPGRLLGPTDDPVAIAAAERAKDGAELVGVLADQLRSRFGVAAVAVWLLDADGALEL